METTTSADFQRKIGHYQDRALVEPVMVTRNGRERVVRMSAAEVPAATKHRLGLDGGRSWIVVSEINRFIWPGVDLLPVPGKAGYEYGVLPPGLFRQVREGITSWVRLRKLRTPPRE